jgi:hypothetical protein
MTNELPTILLISFRTTRQLPPLFTFPQTFLIINSFPNYLVITVIVCLIIWNCFNKLFCWIPLRSLSPPIATVNTDYSLQGWVLTHKNKIREKKKKHLLSNASALSSSWASSKSGDVGDGALKLSCWEACEGPLHLHNQISSVWRFWKWLFSSETSKNENTSQEFIVLVWRNINQRDTEGNSKSIRLYAYVINTILGYLDSLVDGPVIIICKTMANNQISYIHHMRVATSSTNIFLSWHGHLASFVQRK